MDMGIFDGKVAIITGGGKAGCVPFGFRYARHSDEPKAENTRG